MLADLLAYESAFWCIALLCFSLALLPHWLVLQVRRPESAIRVLGAGTACLVAAQLLRESLAQQQGFGVLAGKMPLLMVHVTVVGLVITVLLKRSRWT